MQNKLKKIVKQIKSGCLLRIN